jgi:hypothetical protein
MSWRQRNDEDPSSPTLYFGGADDRVLRVIPTFDDDVRAKMADEVERRIVGENYDEIDTLERAQHVRPLGVGAHGTCRTLEAADRIIAVDPNDERVRAFTGGGENIDVSGMKQVEHSIREGYPSLPCSPPPFGLGPRRDFSARIPRFQSPLVTDGWKWMTRCFLSGSAMISS